MKLTDAICRKATPKDRYLDISDEGTPLTLRIKTDGERLFIWRGRVGGRQTKRIIGVYPAMSLADARLEAMRLKAEARSPTTTIGPIVHAHHRPAVVTVSDGVDRYEREHLVNLATGAEIVAKLKRRVLGAFGDRDIKSLTKQEINQHFNGLRDEGFNGPALNRTVSAFKAYLNWAVREDLIDFNPAASIGRKVVEKPRDRVLVDWELGAILSALSDLEEYAAPVGLLLHTCCRRRDIFDLRWQEVRNRSNGEVELHIQKTKSGVGHIAWLSPQARTYLPARPKDVAEDARVFPNIRLNLGVYHYNALNDAAGRAAKGRAMNRFGLHDFRTACATYLSDKMGRGKHYFTDRALDMMLAHVPFGVTRKHYNLSLALAERQEMLTVWSDYLAECKIKFG